MAKVALKEELREIQDGKFKTTGEIIPEDSFLFDTHRLTPKVKGGTYGDISNVEVVDPVEHMKIHGNLRERPEEFDKLKAIVDDRVQVMKLKNKINNQLKAFERRVDYSLRDIYEHLQEGLNRENKELGKRDRILEKAVKEIIQYDALAAAALLVPNVGPVIVANCIVYIDLKKARHASSLWKYVGVDKPRHKKYVKRESGGGNRTLLTVLYQMAECQMKGYGPYREIYDREKESRSVSEKITWSRNTEGKLIECVWKDTMPSHRHGHALRMVIKHFLADYWFVGRMLQGLPTNPSYAEAILGKEHRTISPRERGWKF